MQHVQGDDRNQMFMFSLESAIPPDSFVRLVDAFVDSIDLKSFGFSHVECKEEGRPAYHPSVLLKLYLYGYHYGIRTTRKLEREAQTNIEAMWLLSGQRPKYKTIADFRKLHSLAFREIFRRFVCLLKEWDLIEGSTLAIDSFKIRGSNSLKKNFNETKLKQHIEYIDRQISEYEQALEQADTEEQKAEINIKIGQRTEKKEQYQQIKDELKESGEDQISLTDPDAKAVIFQRNVVEVGYNIQASSDKKHKMLVEYGTGTVNDSHVLSEIAIRSKELLSKDQITVLADKGYHTGAELEKCTQENITTYVSPKEPAARATGLYPVSSFLYNPEKDIYICPQGEEMKTNHTWYQHSSKTKNKEVAFRFKRYNTPACKTCKSRHLCTQCKTNGRNIDRSEYAEVIEANAERVTRNPEYYRLRQQITEHPFGTLKRQRGFTHTLVRGKEKVLGEVGLMFIGYNLTRCISILGMENLIKALREFSDRIFYIVTGVVSAFLKHFLKKSESPFSSTSCKFCLSGKLHLHRGGLSLCLN